MMTRFHRLQRPARRSQRGLSLVELMVAMVAGLLSVLVVTQAMLANRSTSTTQDDNGRIQEGNRFAFDLLSQHIRLAGFHPSDAWTSFNPVTGTSCAIAADHPICGFNGTTAAPDDELQIRFYGMDNPAGSAPEGGIVDCRGNAIGAATLIEERYRVENRNGVPTLVCYLITGAGNIAAAAVPPNAPGANSNAVAVDLLPGVERLQFLYGFDTNSDGQVDQWLPANPTNDMQRVLAVKVAMVIRGDNQAGATSRDATTYNLFGPDYPRTNDPGAQMAAPNDFRIRKLTSFTVTLRNRVP